MELVLSDGIGRVLRPFIKLGALWEYTDYYCGLAMNTKGLNITPSVPGGLRLRSVTSLQEKKETKSSNESLSSKKCRVCDNAMLNKVVGKIEI